MFSIGLEFSLTKLVTMKRIVFGFGTSQVVISILIVMIIAWLLEMDWRVGLALGGALAMSSTAIVIKMLSERLELNTLHGNLSLGVLLFQDLAAVPFLVLIPLLAQDGEQSMLQLLAFAFVKAAVVFALMLFIGARVLRPLFQRVAATQSKELFTLTVLFVSSCAAWFTNLVGLSLALGAFLAGMMLAETEFRHHIDHELRPFRDILLGVFFITVGMQLDVTALWSELHWIALLVVGLTIGKGSLITFLAYIYNKDVHVAARVGLVLGHGGEFGLALLALALSTGIVEGTQNQIILASVVLSMFIAPLLVKSNGPLTNWLVKTKDSEAQDIGEIAAATEAVNGHVLICGFGRVGTQMAEMLKLDDIDYVAIDSSPENVKTAWEDGEPVFFGDASHPGVLSALAINRARAVVISFSDEDLAVLTLRQIKSVREDIPVLVRSYDDTSLERLMAAGASDVLPETFETGLMLTLNLMLVLGFSEEEVDERLHRERARHHKEKALRIDED